MSTTGKPPAKSGRLSTRSDLPGSVYAFARQRKEPLTNAAHVRNALARFDQVKGVSDADRDRAFAHIQKAGKRFGVTISETHWRQLGKPRRSRSTRLD
jgi:hypothetical protein